MAGEAFREWYIAGLRSLITANEVGTATAKKLMAGVSDSELKAALTTANKAALTRADIIAGLLEEVSPGAEPMANDIIEGIDKVADQIADLPDAAVRNAAVIVAAQHTLHYYMSAYGNLASTAKHLGLGAQAEQLSRFVDEVSATDLALTELAETKVNPAAA